MSAKEQATLHVIARAPFTLYYDGPALSLSALNAVGKFDILPGHADFFSMLLAGEVYIETDKEPIIFNISTGIVSISQPAS